jgi:predicted NBD/HSP70 family sugar kinase
VIVPSAAARPSLIRAINEQLILTHIRQLGPCSRADVARLSGLSKPTVSLALEHLEQAGLVRPRGKRSGVPGRAALLYEINSDAAFTLALQASRHHLRGALTDLSGTVIAEMSHRSTTAAACQGAQLVLLARALCDRRHMSLREVARTVIGRPRLPGPPQDLTAPTRWPRTWYMPRVLAELRDAFGPSLILQTDVDAAALAELTFGHGREADNFAFVSLGMSYGIGMRLILGRRLHRGAHGTAGEIGFLPAADGRATQANTQSPGVQDVRTIARMLSTVITVADPPMIVLGGRAARIRGFAEAIRTELAKRAPAVPEVRVTALGDRAVLSGCIVSATEAAWEQLVSARASRRDQRLGSSLPGSSGYPPVTHAAGFRVNSEHPEGERSPVIVCATGAGAAAVTPGPRPPHYGRGRTCDC